MSKMPGRPYTLREMKQIVEYLVEHRAYGEIRGRKMWVDMSNSKVIDRTWQSLKETFLKRILPDICNTYYNLTVEQIASFRQETDLAAKRNKNRLEVHISDDSNTSGNHRAHEVAVENENQKSGEKQCSKIQNRTRSSTDTLVLENCGNADDIEKDVDSLTKNDKATKSLRDLITYSEPLTPMLQEVIDDFTSDDDPPMQIVEEFEPPENDQKTIKSSSPDTIRESQSYNKKTENVNDEDANKNTQSSKIKSLKLKKTQKGTWENKEPVQNAVTTAQENEANNDESEAVFSGKEKLETEKKPVNAENNSATVDSQLPNNQEALANKSKSNRASTESTSSEFMELSKKKKEKRSRSRSHSQSKLEHKKKKKDKYQTMPESQEQITDTQTFDSHPQSTVLQKELANDIVVTKNTREIANNESVAQSNKSDDTNIPPNVVAENTTNQGMSQEAGSSGIKIIENPCLKPVSLYDEQFSQSKISDSECEDTNQNTSNKKHALIAPINNTVINQVEKNSSVQVENSTSETSLDSSKEIEKYDKTVNKGGTSIYSSSTKHLSEQILLLNSHSDSDSEDFVRPKKITRIRKSRAKALSNVFGFSSGTLEKKQTLIHSRSKTLRVRQQRLSKNKPIVLESESTDDYTTATDSDDPDVHASQKNAVASFSRRYVKPKHYDILKQSKRGVLFVAGRRKLYPVLLREQSNLHYASSTEDGENERINSYWKEKYKEEQKKLAEEKIRADELARLLKETKELQQRMVEPKSPTPQPNDTLSSTSIAKQNKPAIDTPERSVKKRVDENVKIKFTKNKEIELEGQWTHITPVLEKMVALFNNIAPSDLKQQEKESVDVEEKQLNTKEEVQIKKADEKIEEKTGTKATVPEENVEENKQNENVPSNLPEIVKENNNKIVKPKVTNARKRLSTASKRKMSSEAEIISSGKSTPVLVVTQADPEVREKVDMIEKEIFKTIEEIDKSDQSITINGDASDSNVTKRKRGRPKKSTSTSSVISSESIQKVEETVAKKPRAIKKTIDIDESDASTSKRNTKPPKRFANDSEIIIVEKPKTRSKLSLTNKSNAAVEVPDDDDSVRYKLPPKSKAKAEKLNKSYFTNKPAPSSPDSSSRCSQGYLESDISNSPKFIIKKKRRLSTVALLNKRGRIGKVRRRSSPYLADDDTYSINEAFNQKVKNASLSSEVYRSESYQILMPKTKQVTLMDKIEEMQVHNDTDVSRKNFKNFKSLTVEVNNEFYIPPQERKNQLQTSSEPSSSNMSLPLSPELSVVENLSISRELIGTSLQDHPTLNEMQTDTAGQTSICNKYLISEVDVSMPLMQQNCEVHTRQIKNTRNRTRATSESVADTGMPSNNENQTLSDSLGNKLRHLMLESAKKIEDSNLVPLNLVNTKVDNPVQNINSNKTKRRSSTPRKRKTFPKANAPSIESVLEEHTEPCGRSGRKSCPPIIPIINVIPCEEESLAVVPKIPNTTDDFGVKDKKGRKKKDVIKVKIQRPRGKSHSAERTNTKRVSICTDSGINDTGSNVSDCQCCNESNELIHNHSDTCLHMEECVGDSVEIVENSSTTVISLNSDSSSLATGKLEVNQSSEEFVTPESFCTIAQDATSIDVAKPTEEGDTATEYHTPPGNRSFDSLITEDLSDESSTQRKTKWYLLSEDETNFQDAQSQSSVASLAGVGSNLKQIFPVTCAVPDLSTITEMSKENESKPTFNNNDSEMATFSQSIFEFSF